MIDGEEFDIFYEGGRFGAKDKEGKIIVEAIYEDAKFFSARREIMIRYENGVMYYIYVFNNERYTEDEW